MTTSLRASASGPLQRATGWTATRSAPALPATCALHREGSNSALYLSPAPVGAVARWLDLPGEDQAVLLDPEPGVPTRVMPWSLLAARSADADVVHLPATASLDSDSLAALPSPLLAALAEAVPRAHGGRVAISAADSGHTVVVSRERRLLARCLDGFLRALILRAMSGEVCPPPFSGRTLAPLLAPLAADAWFTFEFQVYRRFWTLDATRHGDDPAGHRWVCEGPQGRWREGWSWTSANAEAWHR